MCDLRSIDCRARIASVAAGVVAASIGSYHLVAWLNGSMAYSGFNHITMKTNAALCLFMGAISLLIAAIVGDGVKAKVAARILAILVFVIGGLTLLEHLFGLNFQIDQMLAHEPPGATGIISPNRMGPPGATTYLIGGLSLFLLWQRGRGVLVAQWLTVPLCFIALMGMLGYLYQVKGLYGAARFTVIALPATIGNFFLGVGILLARPREGLMARITSFNPGGAAMRRLIPAAVLVPILLGWLRLQGEWHGLYETYYGTCILVLSVILVFTVLVYRTGTWISRSAEAEAKAREELTRSHALFVEAERLSHTGAWEWDLAKGNWTFSEEWQRIHGMEKQTLSSAELMKIAHAEDRPAVESALNEILSGESPYYLEHRIIRQDTGEVRTVRARGQFLKDTAGNVVRVYGFVQDITEAKQAEEELRNQRQLLEAVVENMPAGIFLAKGDDFRIVLVNSQYQSLAVGKEMVGKTVEEVWPEIQPWFGDIQRRVAATGIPHHAVDDRILLTRAHGAPLEERYFTWSTVRVALPGSQGWGVLTTAWETTQRKRTEEELENARDLLKGILEGAASNIAAVDTEHRFLAMNNAYRQIFKELFGVEARVGNRVDEVLAHLPEQQVKAMALWRRALQGETFIVEEEFGLTGRSRHFEIRFSPIKDGAGIIVGATQISSDITARKEAEEALRQSEEKFRAVFEQAAVGIGRVGFSEARWIDVNEAFLHMLGYTVEEMLTIPWPEMTHPNDVDLDLVPFRRMAAGELEKYSVEKRFIHKDGHHVWARLTLSLVRNAAGKPDYEIAIIEDISDRKRAEIELRESEHLLNTVLDNLPVGVWIIDRLGRLIRGNEKAKEIWRGARYVGVEDFGEYRGWRLDTGERIEAEDWGGVKAITRGETTFEQEVEIECFDGSRKVLLDSAVPMTNERGEITGAVTVNQDVSLRKEAEAALRESETRFRGIFENAAVGISLFDRAGRLMEANAKLYETLGYQEKELKGLSFENFTNPADYEPDRSNYRQMMGGKLPYYTVEKRYIRKDGTLVWVRVTRAVQRGPAGEPLYSINVIEDISARKHAEEELRRTAALLHAVTENTPDFIFVKDRAGRMLMANPATLKDLGKREEDVLGKTDAEFLGGEGAQRIMENDRKVMERGETLVVEEVPHPDGDRHVYLSSKSPYLDENGAMIGLIGISRDITHIKQSGEERERLLAELQRSNEDLQQFAYVASHDLQEPLRMVSSYMQLLERRYRDRLDEKAQTYIDHAVDGTKRMQSLIEGLLKYSRISRENKLTPVDTNAAYAAAVANLQGTIAEADGVVTSDHLPTVQGDEIQLIQLFQNLVGNGIKYRKAGRPPQIHVSARSTGKEWLFSIRDNGMGIERQHFDKVFQIFQRLHTQDEIPGTGIGLASCKKIVERHGGKIWVESQPGEGSIFYFTIPSSS